MGLDLWVAVRFGDRQGSVDVQQGEGLPALGAVGALGRGMGALEFRPARGSHSESAEPLRMKSLVEAARQVLRGGAYDFNREFSATGYSIGYNGPALDDGRLHAGGRRTGSISSSVAIRFWRITGLSSTMKQDSGGGGRHFERFSDHELRMCQGAAGLMQNLNADEVKAHYLASYYAFGEGIEPEPIEVFTDRVYLMFHHLTREQIKAVADSCDSTLRIDSSAPDFTLPGLQCLRALQTGDGDDARRVQAGIAQTAARFPRTRRPVVVIHGLDDGLVPPAFSSAPYVEQARIANPDVRYWQVRNAQHFDGFLGLPDYAARYVPLLPYVYQALDRVQAHLDGKGPLPADAVIPTVPRGARNALEARNLAMPAH